MKPTKILVTGVCGLIGSWITKALLKEGHTVVGFDSLMGGYIENAPHRADRFIFMHSTIEDYLYNVVGVPTRYKVELKFCQGLLDDIEVVYHCAALAYEGLSVFSPHLITTNILGATTAAASLGIANGMKLFVNCSSMARYGDISFPYREYQYTNPIDPYGLAKVQAEQQLNLLAKIHNFRVVHLVPHNVIGPGQCYDDPHRNVVSITINRLIQGKQPIIYGDGNQVRCFSYITDIIPVMLKMLDVKIFPNEIGMIFNVGPDSNPVSINELVGWLQNIVGTDYEPIHVKARPQEVKNAYCSSDKIRDWFQFEEKVLLKEALVEMVKYVKESPVRDFKYKLPLEIINDKTPKTWTDKLI